jgi:hypothetical protein
MKLIRTHAYPGPTYSQRYSVLTQGNKQILLELLTEFTPYYTRKNYHPDLY